MEMVLSSLIGGGGGASSGSGMLGGGAPEESLFHGSCGATDGGASGSGSGIGRFRERMRSTTSNSSMGWWYMGLIFVVLVDKGPSRARSGDLALSSTMAWRRMKKDSTRR